ncbi:hypothetical protein T492DRAFT_1081496 [Pavlovales sp. CCMP2436]|nr:hypothetical protein T492DRAFT_1081496 [Pavlovales sp. CCMP2436]
MYPAVPWAPVVLPAELRHPTVCTMSARPKSASFDTPPVKTSTFSGFTSPCATPRLCTHALQETRASVGSMGGARRPNTRVDLKVHRVRIHSCHGSNAPPPSLTPTACAPIALQLPGARIMSCTWARTTRSPGSMGSCQCSSTSRRRFRRFHSSSLSSTPHLTSVPPSPSCLRRSPTS